MKRYFLFLVFAFLVCMVSCHKPLNDLNTTTPTSGDSLLSWKAIYLTGAGDGIVDIWFTSPSTGYYLSINGRIYQSKDTGNTWQTTLSDATLTGPLYLLFINQQYGFAESLSQIQITRDGGNSWITKTLPTAQASNMFFVSPSTGYYCDVDSGLYKTTDTCTIWTKVYHSAVTPYGTNLGYYPFFVNENTGFVASGDGEFAKTTNSSDTWSHVASGISPVESVVHFNTLLFVDSLRGYYANASNLIRTIDGGQTWATIMPGGGNINSLKFPSANTGYYSSGTAIYKTTDGGLTWQISCKLGSDGFLGMSFVGNTGWACTVNGYIYRITQ